MYCVLVVYINFEPITPAVLRNIVITCITTYCLFSQCFTHNYLGWKIHVVDDYNTDTGMVYMPNMF